MCSSVNACLFIPTLLFLIAGVLQNRETPFSLHFWVTNMSNSFNRCKSTPKLKLCDDTIKNGSLSFSVVFEITGRCGFDNQLWILPLFDFRVLKWWQPSSACPYSTCSPNIPLHLALWEDGNSPYPFGPAHFVELAFTFTPRTLR